MDWSLLYLLPLVVAIILTVVAFRAHERYWSLGFLGWRRVYLGLGAYMAAGIISGILYWVTLATPTSGAIPWLQGGLVLFSAIGIILILHGSIERLRELSAEHAHLEDVRAGFDLFDTLREVIGQPYAFLEVLDYALKEMVRAAGVDSGGLWLYNQSKSEWILTGWANLSEKLRQQTESVKGSGSGFDRLASAHKARLFVGADKLRSSFPEWEAEGFQSILGLPLVSGSVGSGGRQVLGAIILADCSAHRFDDDRARRLYAASDYVAAVIAEARIVRQLDSARSQVDGAYAELEREREEARKQKQAAEQHLLELKQQAEEEKAALESRYQSQLTKDKDEAAAALKSTREELETKHAQELKSLRDDHQSQLAAIQKRHDEELARIRQDAASQKQSLESRIGEMENAHREEMQGLRREHDTARSAIESRHAEELKRIRQEARAEKQSLETRLAEVEKAHRADVQQLRAEHDSAKSELQARHADELARVRQEAASAREALEAQLAQAQNQHQDELQSLRSEYESVIDDAETVHAEELRLANVETDKVRQDFESRLRDAHTQVEALKTTISEMETRAVEERRSWEGRLDELHRTDQDERAKERERHDAIAAHQQEELKALQERNADLQARLDDIERVAAEHAASLRTAQATLQERDETLQTERRSRDELVASHKETLGVLQARLDTASSELAEYRERAESLRHELERVQQAASDRQAELIGERDEKISHIAQLTDDLEKERATAETHKQRLERELESFKLMLVEREKQLASWRDAHREACAEARTFEEKVASLENEMTKTIEDARETINTETQRRTELEDELAALHRERTDLEERRQRELVEERLDHRRKLHKVEFEMATLRERLQRALAVPDPLGRVETLVRCIAERIPSAHIYVWRRETDGAARMIGWMNDERELFDGQNLPPWTFEQETIPAEGITELTDAAELGSRISAHPQHHHDVWLAHWSPNAQPLWGIVWPWQGSGTLGWVTVFGFDAQAPAGETIDEIDTWVGLVGAAIESLGDVHLTAPVEPMAPSELSRPDDDVHATDAEHHEDAIEPHETHDTREMYTSDEDEIPSEVNDPEPFAEPAEEPQSTTDEHSEGEPEPVDEAPPVERRWIDLHNVILNWAAHQTEDALRLDLTAQPSITVDEHWLRDTLEHGRQSCRSAESLGGEFIVSTLRQNGHTVVRLVRGGEQTEPEQDNVAAVEDTELITETASSGDAPDEIEHDSPVSGRWLVRDGNRIGMELRFSHTGMDDDQRAEVENQQVTGHVRTVLVADDDDAMVELLTGMIDSLGNDALTASDRDAAQEKLRVHDVDVVIINASMGGGTGWNVARWFKDANPQLPVVLVVGAETMSVPDDFPGDWMLRLPFQIDELRECLDSLTTVKA